MQDRFVGRIDVDQVHAGGRHHRIAGRHVCHANHALEHLARFGVDDLVVFSLGQGLDQFILRVRAGMKEFGELLQKTALVFPLGMTRRMRNRHCI